MNQKEKKALVISLFLSLIIHLTIFLLLYFFNLPEKKEEEKIITVSLENLPPVKEKPSISQEKQTIQPKPIQPPKKPVIEQPQPQPTKQTTPKQEEKIQPKIVEKTPLEEKPKQETVSQEQKPQITENVENKTTAKQESPQPPAPAEKPQPIDISKGRPDTFKQPEKKEEDINGYLKELIRYLNQQARERDLYPPLAKRLKIEGQVIVRVTINEDGTIDENSIKIVDPSGYNVLDKGAIEILKKLQPYKKPPKRITVEIPIVFQIIYM
ncbi:energy transducer TonB [Sulfurihydrogenibium azorense]|uniref:energy transducer TonB n=1 Tax=Sulfurihydrogenibium azorense TaxID=309806 RepID=UPI002409D048|nr:energy transducer TonB [Sulfurihydrogenibium azorense]MDM7273899.1 TonB family protein [Sulfurihydrogenibium azorense]